MSQPAQVLWRSDRFQVVRRAWTSGDGRPLAREFVEHPGAVTIIPMVDAEHVCLIQNLRMAIDRTLLELPAGTREPGEEPEQTAVRELAEETGFRAERIERLHRFWMSPGIMNEQMHLYLATGLSSVPRQLDATEQIEPLVVPWDEAMRRVAAGEVADAKTLVGLLFFDRIRRDLGAGSWRPLP